MNTDVALPNNYNHRHDRRRRRRRRRSRRLRHDRHHRTRRRRRGRHTSPITLTSACRFNSHTSDVTNYTMWQYRQVPVLSVFKTDSTSTWRYCHMV